MTERPQSPAEELTNAVVHGVGAVLGLTGLATTALGALLHGGRAVVIGALLAYTATVLVLFGTSTAYHWTTDPRWKMRLQKADHCAIYLLIAGTYTPFALAALGGFWGMGLFAAVWTLAVVGIGLELALRPRRHRISLALYLAMGWMAVLVAVPLVRALPVVSSVLILVGGLLYTVGVPFYTRDARWDHARWHGFVLGGAVTHGAAVVLALA
jgi:hemolysin III